MTDPQAARETRVTCKYGYVHDVDLTRYPTPTGYCPPCPDCGRRRPYTARIGMDAIVVRADGSSIDFGDAIYHPENVAEAEAYAALRAATPDPAEPNPYGKGDDWKRDIAWQEGYEAALRAVTPDPLGRTEGTQYEEYDRPATPDPAHRLILAEKSVATGTPLLYCSCGAWQWHGDGDVSIDHFLLSATPDPAEPTGPERFDRTWSHYADDCPTPPGFTPDPAEPGSSYVTKSPTQTKPECNCAPDWHMQDGSHHPDCPMFATPDPAACEVRHGIWTEPHDNRRCWEPATPDPAAPGLREAAQRIVAMADRFSKQAKDAAAIHDAFHDGVASAFHEAARSLRATPDPGEPSEASCEWCPGDGHGGHALDCAKRADRPANNFTTTWLPLVEDTPSPDEPGPTSVRRHTDAMGHTRIEYVYDRPAEPGLREALCLTCGATAPDPLAGCCGECGAEDGFIGTQWLEVPHDQRPLREASCEWCVLDCAKRAATPANNFTTTWLPLVATTPDPAEPGLDVERLARALSIQAFDLDDQSWDYGEFIGIATPREAAAHIADAYDRLAHSEDPS